MLIRKNPVRLGKFNLEKAHFCARLPREIIRAYDMVISQFPEARAVGYFATSSVVECIHHLFLHMHYNKDGDGHAACVSAFIQAHSILVRRSAFNNMATRTLKAPNGIIDKWGSNNAGVQDNSRSANAVLRQEEIAIADVRRASPCSPRSAPPTDVE